MDALGSVPLMTLTWQTDFGTDHGDSCLSRRDQAWQGGNKGMMHDAPGSAGQRSRTTTSAMLSMTEIPISSSRI